MTFYKPSETGCIKFFPKTHHKPCLWPCDVKGCSARITIDEICATHNCKRPKRPATTPKMSQDLLRHSSSAFISTIFLIVVLSSIMFLCQYKYRNYNRLTAESPNNNENINRGPETIEMEPIFIREESNRSSPSPHPPPPPNTPNLSSSPQPSDPPNTPNLKAKISTFFRRKTPRIIPPNEPHPLTLRAEMVTNERFENMV